MDKKPSSIHSKNLKGISRRRLIKALTGVGFSVTAASRLTAEDVKAADTDQVPISLDTEGKRKVMVSSDWYDRLTQARDVFEKLEKKWMKKDPVTGVWLSAGSKGGENPHVIIQVDNDHPRKDEAKGEAPERKNGVPVETEEHGSTKTTGCSDYDDSTLSDNLPGGVKCRTVGHEDEVIGTLSPRMEDKDLDRYHGYFMTAGHVPGCDRAIPSTNQGKSIGKIVEINKEIDVAIIEPASDVDALGEVAEVSDFSDGRRHRLDGTLTKDGVHHWENNDKRVFKYGYGGCYHDGQVQATGTTDTYAVCDGGSARDHPGQVRWGDSDQAPSGDSGTVTFGADPYGDGYFAISMVNAVSGLDDPEYFADYVTGISGYYLDNNYGWYWH